MTDWNAIRQAIDEATPGPWERRTYGHRDRRSQQLAINKALIKRVPDTDLVPTDLTWVEVEGKSVALIGNGPRQTENGDFIAIARSALPDMLALLVEARGRLEYFASRAHWTAAGPLRFDLQHYGKPHLWSLTGRLRRLWRGR